MVSVATAKSILNKNGKKYNDEQIKKIKEMLCFWAALEYTNYLKKKQYEKRNNL